MKSHLLPTDKILNFVTKLSENGPVFYPILEDAKAHLIKFDAKKDFVPNFMKIRTAENIKHFFFPSRDIVAKFPRDGKRQLTNQYLLGVKNCDLKGIDIYNRVFLNWEPIDPFYKERMANTIVISADCPEPEDSCFCNLVGLNPYGDKICDINITHISSGLLFEVFTKKGEDVVNANSNLFNDASEADKKEREQIRTEASTKLSKINDKQFRNDLATRVDKAEKNKIRDARNECVECHACLHACPTCYCFLLSDYKKGTDIERVRLWDACYYAAYARVGGGANPRSRIDERFWNRFQCKFNYFNQYENIYACSGCGRCSLGCSAKIDIREILWNI